MNERPGLEGFDELGTAIEAGNPRLDRFVGALLDDVLNALGSAAGRPVNSHG